jgi:hypothetical protein
MQRLVIAIGSLAVLMASFFGTLSFLDSLNYQTMDSIRIEHAKTLKGALEKYRAAHGRYPASSADSDLTALRAPLVDGGFVAQLPVDPYWKSGRVNKYRYRAVEGTSYGLLFHMELGPCQTGVGGAATGPWESRAIAVCAF